MKRRRSQECVKCVLRCATAPMASTSSRTPRSRLTAVAPEIGEQLQVNIKEAVQRHLGLPVAEVQVHTQVEALDTTRRVR